ncbi:uncharacterized protein LOC129951875 [Eupeodes corollae]|uniref:uncharacterized protein LOC129951875 n=1 Tax=Eupeodes corollae TaxID=290404 RepID=UPI002492A7C4|nr:uncharacterized protein LOC129951875 [Eupeodes corollae]
MSERRNDFLRTVVKPTESSGYMQDGHQSKIQQQRYIENRKQNFDPRYGDQMKYIEETMNHRSCYNNIQENNHYRDFQQLQQEANRGGGGDYRDNPSVSKQNYFQDEYPQHKKSQTDFKDIKSDETFFPGLSDRSDSTKQTAIKKQITNRKQLYDLVGSKASLHKDIDESITNVNNHATKTYRRPEKPLNSKLQYSVSEEDLLPCSTCQSAELINEKFIHPMIKKFRLLYLHNIKEEVGIMEDLETLPNKLAKFCQEMENNL